MFILLVRTASQSLRLPFQHFAIRRSPLFPTFTVFCQDFFLFYFILIDEAVKKLSYPKTATPIARLLLHSECRSRSQAPGLCRLLDSIDEKKSTLSIWRKGRRGKVENNQNPASRAVRWLGFLGSDWFQKGKNYSANTTIISCLATAHQSRGTTQADSPCVLLQLQGSLKETQPSLLLHATHGQSVFMIWSTGFSSDRDQYFRTVVKKYVM